MKFALYAFMLFLATQFTNAQVTSKIDFFLGYGYYEGYNIGSEYYFDKQGAKSMSLSFGYNKSLNKREEGFATALGYDFAIFKKRVNKLQQFKWRASNRLVLWKLEDPYYTWKVLSIIPSINRRFILYKKINLSIDLGPSFNIVLYNRRKTFEDVGWPYHVMPNLRIVCIL